MARTIYIHKSLVLFPTDTGNLETVNLIDRGEYQVERVRNPLKKRGAPWLKVVGESWGNAEVCWKAVSRDIARPRRSFQPASSNWPGVILAALCLGLIFLRPHDGPSEKDLRNLPELKMQLAGLVNQLDNLTNHYSLLSSDVQTHYQKCYEDAIYSLDIYPRYRAVQQAQEGEVLRQRPDLEPYVAAVNALDEEFYRAWHDWGIPNRPELLAQLQEKKQRVFSTETMKKHQPAYERLRAAQFTAENVGPSIELNERIEQEIVDANPVLQDVARQNRDCVDRALNLLMRINLLQTQIAQLTKPEKLLKTARAF